MNALKRFFGLTLLFITLSFSILHAQSWEMLNPYPTFNSIYSLSFPSPDTGFIVGNNSTLMRTIDGGDSWEKIDFPVEGVQIRFVDFWDNNHGIVVAWSHIFMTSDGGETWNYSHKQLTSDFVAAHFINDSTGWIAGTYRKMLKTTDGGANWDQLNPPGLNMEALEFASAEVGYYAGNKDHLQEPPKLFKTLDGGENWTAVNLPEHLRILADMSVISPEKLWIASHYLMPNQDSTEPVFKTFYSDNSGESWTDVEIGPSDGSPIEKMKFLNENDGYVMTYKRLYITHDGGQTWENHEIKEFPFGRFMDFSAANASVLVAAGTGPMLMKSTDGGQNWTELVKGRTDSWQSIYFLDEEHGFVGTSKLGGAIIWRTEDGGNTWQDANCEMTELLKPLESINFLSPLKGFATVRGPQILQTTDGGLYWTLKDTGFPYAFANVSISPDGVIFLTALDAKMIKSTDGGESWTEISPTLEDGLIFDYQLVFVDGQTGFMNLRKSSMGINTIIKTTDGGQSWTMLDQNFPNRIMSMSFSDAQNGMATDLYEGIYSTQDGGISWSEPQLIGGNPPNFVQLFSADHAVASYRSGMVAITADGGQNWEIRYEGSAESPIMSKNFFLDEGHGWLAGQNGLVMRYTDEFLSIPTFTAANKPQIFKPNPARNVIQLLLPGQKQLKIFNSLGSMVFNKENFTAEYLSVDFLPSGIYFIVVESGNQVFTEKMIKK